MTIDVMAEGLTPERPWPGLDAYTEADQSYFFGRDDDTMTLLRCVMRERLTVLLGQSGLGKTSLLRAGLFPKLRAENLVPVYIRLDYKTDAPAPGAQVLQSIAQTIADEKIDAPAPAAADRLWDYFHRTDLEWWSPRNYQLAPVLVFDQFEEVFTIGRQGAGPTFLDELGDLIEERAPPGSPDSGAPQLRFKILLSFREDFLPEFEAVKRRIHSLFINRVRLSRLTGEAALNIVSKSGGHLMAPETAAQIVHFVAADPGAARPLPELPVEPALLCVFCRELNERRIATGAAAIEPATLRGGQQAILQQMLDRAFADLPPAVLDCAGEYLLTDTGYRAQYPLADLARRARVPAPTILRLETRRIFRVENRGDVDWVELTHDLLAPLVLQRRDERRQAARYRWLVRMVAAIGTPLLLTTLGMIFLANRAASNAAQAAANLAVAENALVHSLDAGNPNTDSVTKKQDLVILLKDAGYFAARDPVVAANSYVEIARIQLTATMQPDNGTDNAFMILTALWHQNPNNLAVGKAYESALLDRAAAATDARQLPSAEYTFQSAAGGLRVMLQAAPKNLMSQRALVLLLDQAYEGLGDDYQSAGQSASGAAAATDHANEAAAYRQAVNVLDQFVAAYPADPVGTAELAWAVNKSGDTARDEGDEADAKAFYNRAYVLLSGLRTHLNDDPKWPQHLGLIEMNLGVYQVEDDDYAGGLTFFTQAQKVFMKLHENLEPQNDDVASDIGWAEDWIGFSYYLLAQSNDPVANRIAAERALSEAATERQQIALRQPNDVQWQDDLTHSEAGLAALQGLAAIEGKDANSAIKDFGQAATLTAEILREGTWEQLRLADFFDQKARAELALNLTKAARADFANAAKVMPAETHPSLFQSALANRIASDERRENY